MIAPDFISDSIPPLHVEDTVNHALLIMQQYNVGQIPVLEGKKYAGMIAMDEIISLKPTSQSIKDFQLPLRKPFVVNTAHIFDVMKAAVEFEVKVVPVINEDAEYLGSISAESCLRAFALLNSVKEVGAIIELEIPLSDYSVSKIARIVEDNEANIICFYTNINQSDGVVNMTIKVDTTEVNSLIAAFERYEYEVKTVHNDSEYTEEIKDRYDALMRYLNV